MTRAPTSAKHINPMESSTNQPQLTIWPTKGQAGVLIGPCDGNNTLTGKPDRPISRINAALGQDRRNVSRHALGSMTGGISSHLYPDVHCKSWDKVVQQSRCCACKAINIENSRPIRIPISGLKDKHPFEKLKI